MIIDGISIAKTIQNEIKQEISTYQGRPPCLATILVGEHPASQLYVKRKRMTCELVGISSLPLQFPDSISEQKLLEEIAKLNADKRVDGILVQLPLPQHISALKVTMHISPDKDVDGLNPVNAGKLLIGDPSGLVSCTPLGIKVLLQKSNIDVAGRHVVVMGRSNLVGKPVAVLLMQNAPGANATVTVLHSASKNPMELTRMADILIVAMGRPKYIQPEMIKEGAVIIDVGTNKIDAPTKSGSQLAGDVDFEAVKSKCAAITPVPGGVGPMTIAMLMQNTLQSFKNTKKT